MFERPQRLQDNSCGYIACSSGITYSVVGFLLYLCLVHLGELVLSKACELGRVCRQALPVGRERAGLSPLQDGHRCEAPPAVARGRDDVTRWGMRELTYEVGSGTPRPRREEHAADGRLVAELRPRSLAEPRRGVPVVRGVVARLHLEPPSEALTEALNDTSSDGMSRVRIYIYTYIHIHIYS